MQTMSRSFLSKLNGKLRSCRVDLPEFPRGEQVGEENPLGHLIRFNSAVAEAARACKLQEAPQN